MHILNYVIGLGVIQWGEWSPT